MTQTRKPLYFLLFAAFMATTMFYLGAWQIQRLHWKEALIASLDTAAKAEPLTTLPAKETLSLHDNFSRYRLNGTFLNNKEIHLAVRYFKGKLGYHLLTPFKTTDGTIILLNRGWIPTEKKELNKRPKSLAEGIQTVTFMLRSDKDHTSFTPDNQPAKNMWFWRDIPTISKVAGVELYPLSGDVIGEQNPETLPVPSSGIITLRNDHLGYALTWFGIGISIVVMSIIYARKAKRHGN